MSGAFGQSLRRVAPEELKVGAVTDSGGSVRQRVSSGLLFEP